VLHPEGFDLDASALLISDRLVIDRAAYDYIRDPERRYLAPMAASLHRLGDADRLRVEDFGALANSFQSELTHWVERQLESPTHWLTELRAHIFADLPSSREQATVIGSSADARLESIPFGVLCYLRQQGDRIRLADAERIRKLVVDGRYGYTVNEQVVLREVARPYVLQTAFDKLISQKLSMPFVMWESDKPFHTKVGPPEIVQSLGRKITRDQLEETRRVFADVIPELRPISVDEILEFIRHPAAAAALRRAVQRSVRRETQLNRSSIDALKNELILSTEAGAKRSKVVKALFALLGLVASAGGTHYAGLGEAAVEGMHLVLDLLEFAVDERSERNVRARFGWYIELLKIVQGRADARH